MVVACPNSKTCKVECSGSMSCYFSNILLYGGSSSNNLSIALGGGVSFIGGKLESFTNHKIVEVRCEKKGSCEKATFDWEMSKVENLTYYCGDGYLKACKDVEQSVSNSVSCKCYGMGCCQSQLKDCDRVDC